MKKLLLPLLLISTVNVSANSETSVLESFISNTNDYRKDIHNYLIDMSSNLDNYVDDSKKLDIKRYSSAYGLLELSAFQNQHGNVSFDQKVKIRLKLPKLKDNFRLVFESDEVDENKDFIENHNSNANDDFNLGLSYDTLKKDVKLKAKVGIKLHNKLDPFIKLSANKTWENIYNDIDFTVGQNIKESVVKKLESTSFVSLDKQLNEYYSLHHYTEYYWQSGEKADSEVIPSIYLNQEINSKNYLTYSFTSNINNIDSNLRIKRHSAKVNYRHFIKKWLYVDAVPENYYSDANDFKPRYAIRFNFGIYFNKGSYN